MELTPDNNVEEEVTLVRPTAIQPQPDWSTREHDLVKVDRVLSFLIYIFKTR